MFQKMAVVKQLSCQLHRNLPEEEDKKAEEIPLESLQPKLRCNALLPVSDFTCTPQPVQWSPSSTRTRRRGFSVCSGSLRFSSSSMRPPPPRRRTPSATTMRGDTSTPERLSGCQFPTIPCTSAKPRVSPVVTTARLSSRLSRRSWRGDARVSPTDCRQLLQLETRRLFAKPSVVYAPRSYLLL